MNLELRTQAQILSDVRSLLRDGNGARWEDAEIYLAINETINLWEKRVSVPSLYSLIFSAGTWEYDLPTYIDDDSFLVQVQHVISAYPYAVSPQTTLTWVDVPGWSVEPSAVGARKLRLHAQLNAAGRIIFWARNSRVPSTVPTISGSTLTSSGTSVTLSALVDVAETGFLKIEGEYIQYAGISRSGSSVTLTGLVRGLFGSAAASHVANTPVYWCVAVPRADLWVQMSNQIESRLQRMVFVNAAPEEREVYAQMIQFALKQANDFWRTFIPEKRSKHLLTEYATMGAL